ncbi:MAG: hypothetical protein R6V47_05960 [Candidatus Delongbacteria bacterium]
MKNREQKKIDPEFKKKQQFEDLVDEEYFEMVELIEKKKKGIISDQELKKLKYIKKTRENLYGGNS